MLTRLPYNQKVLASDLTAVGGSRNGYESFLCRVKQGRNSFPASQGQSESFRNAYPKRRLRPAFRARARRGRASLGFFPALCRGSMAADGEALGIFRSASRKTGSLIGKGRRSVLCSNPAARVCYSTRGTVREPSGITITDSTLPISFSAAANASSMVS